jgi:hypothetical protein
MSEAADPFDVAAEFAQLQLQLHDALESRDRAHRAIQLLARERDAARAELAVARGVIADDERIFAQFNITPEMAEALTTAEASAPSGEGGQSKTMG